jgi:tetratricopeptide (TPR) repeat protein
MDDEFSNTNGVFEPAVETLRREVVLDKIVKSIRRLPVPLREPALLHFILEMPYRDIALQCNLSYANVRKRIQKVRRILSKEFQGVNDYKFCFSAFKKGPGGRSSTWAEITREASMILNREFREINGSYAASNIVQLYLPSGIEKSVQFFFKTGLRRQEVKLKRLLKYVNCYPRGWKKRMELAELLYAMGKWPRAIDEFYLALQGHPQSLDAWLRLVEILRDIDQEEAAVKALETAIPFARKESTKYHLKGMIELCRSRVDDSLTAFSTAASLEKTNEVHQQRRAMVFLLADRPVEALQAFEEALKINPLDLYSLTYSYDCLVLLGRLTEAEQYVQRALEIYPHDIMALKREADQRCRRGLVRKEEGKKTRKLILKMKKKSPQVPEVQESLIIYYFYRGEAGKGLESLKRLARQKANFPYYWYYYGGWLYRTGSYQLAAEAAIKAFTLYKEDPRVYCRLCKILAHTGMENGLRVIIRGMLRRFPGHWRVFSCAGLALVNVHGEMNRAGELSAYAPKLQPKLPEAYFRHGRVLSLTHKPVEAIDALLKGWQLLPENDAGLQSAPAAWYLAQNYKMIKEEIKAGSWWEEAVKRAAKLKDFIPAAGYYWMGKALYELKDIKGANQALRRALSHQLFYPERQEAKSLLMSLARNAKRNKNRSKLEKFTRRV